MSSGPSVQKALLAFSQAHPDAWLTARLDGAALHVCAGFTGSRTVENSYTTTPARFTYAVRDLLHNFHVTKAKAIVAKRSQEGEFRPKIAWELQRLGFPANVAAEALGVNASTMTGYRAELRYRDLKGLPLTVRDERRKEAARLYSEGVRTADIAKATGLSGSGVLGAARAFGVTLRPRGNAGHRKNTQQGAVP